MYDCTPRYVHDYMHDLLGTCICTIHCMYCILADCEMLHLHTVRTNYALELNDRDKAKRGSDHMAALGSTVPYLVKYNV